MRAEGSNAAVLSIPWGSKPRVTFAVTLNPVFSSAVAWEVLMMTMGPRDAFQWERLGFLGMSSDCTSLKWSFPWEMMKQKLARIKKPQGISDPCEIKTRNILSCNKNLKHLSYSNTSQGSAAMSTPMFYSQPTSIAGSTINNNKMSPSGKILQKYFSFIFSRTYKSHIKLMVCFSLI